MLKDMDRDHIAPVSCIFAIIILIISICLGNILQEYFMARLGLCYQLVQVMNHPPISRYSKCK